MSRSTAYTCGFPILAIQTLGTSTAAQRLWPQLTTQQIDTPPRGSHMGTVSSYHTSSGNDNVSVLAVTSYVGKRELSLAA